MTTSAEKKDDGDAHNVALEWLKQIITLSSGVVVISSAFVKSLFDKPSWTILILLGTWLLLIVAIITALNTISHITRSRIESNNDWMKGKGKFQACIAKFCFVAGISVFVIFAVVNAGRLIVSNKEKKENKIEIILGDKEYITEIVDRLIDRLKESNEIPEGTVIQSHSHPQPPSNNPDEPNV